MVDICANVSELKEEIKKMLKEQQETKLNQTAALDGMKITDIKSSVGAYHRTPKGKAVIYTGHPTYPTLEPNSRDVIEMIEHERPFMCRALAEFGRTDIGCYTPANSLYKFVENDMKQAEEAASDLRDIIKKRWGVYKPQTGAEKALTKELGTRRHTLTDILDDLAKNILKTCRKSL